MLSSIEIPIKLVETIQNQIQSISSEKNRTDQEKYMKFVDKYRGVKSPEVKAIFSEYWKSDIKSLDNDIQKELAHHFLKQTYAEDRYIGAMIFEKNSKSLEKEDVERVKKLFEEGNIKGWAGCDLVCGKILKFFATKNPQNTKHILEWSGSKNNWLQRASCVAFVNLARHGDKEPNFPGFTKLLLNNCSTTIKNQERFVQLGTGWLLREIGVSNKSLLLEFIENHTEHFTREGLSYAIEKLSGSDQKKMKNLLIRPNLEEVEKETGNAPKKKVKKE